MEEWGDTGHPYLILVFSLGVLTAGLILKI
jgi:hypothetical protein